jgi:hypothetical protein
MGTLRIQLSLYPYLVSICLIELNVLRISKSQAFEINSYKCNKGHKGIQSYFHPFQCYFIKFICLRQDKNGDVVFNSIFAMSFPINK